MIIINFVWFGSLLPSVLTNFKACYQLWQASDHAQNYQFNVWTDITQWSEENTREIKQLNFNLCDYHLLQDLHYPDFDLVARCSELLVLGTLDDKIPYVLASDLVRIPILLSYLPARHPEAIGVYLDANDEQLQQLPSPTELQDFIQSNSSDGVLLSRCQFAFQQRDGSTEKTPLMNNNFIVADYLTLQQQALENKPRIYTAHMANAIWSFDYFKQHHQSTLPQIYAQEQQQGRIGKKTARAIIFSLFQSINVLPVINDKTYLVTRNKDQFTFCERINAKDERAKLLFKGPYLNDQGLTWSRGPNEDKTK